MAARFVWGGLTLLFLLGLFMTRSAQDTALNTEIQDAQTRASGYANTTIAQAAVVDVDAGTITFVPKEFTVDLQAGVFTDPTVARVRVWDADGQLQASSDPSEDVGRSVAADDPSLAAAVKGTTSAQIVQEAFTYSTVGAAPVSTQLLQVFVPLRAQNQVQPVGAVQVDFLYASLQAASSSPWTSLSRVFLILTLVAAALFVLSLVRHPITAGERAEMATVPMAPSSEPVVVDVAEARNDELEEELQAAREQLRQATEAFAFLETRMKDGSGTVAASADVNAATERITELEVSLNRAEAEAALARSSAVTQEDLDRVRHEADERVAELERRMEETGAPAVDPEAEALRARLAEAEARAKEAEAELAAAHEQQDVSDAAPHQPKPEPQPEPETQATKEPTEPADLIAELEMQVAAAEARAKEAEDEALQRTPEANDLRARLTRNAARKKLGPTG